MRNVLDQANRIAISIAVYTEIFAKDWIVTATPKHHVSTIKVTARLWLILTEGSIQYTIAKKRWIVNQSDVLMLKTVY